MDEFDKEIGPAKGRGWWIVVLALVLFAIVGVLKNAGVLGRPRGKVTQTSAPEKPVRSERAAPVSQPSNPVSPGPNCVNGQRCGNSCISKNKVCRK
jgi:hypothetical protein